MKKVLIAGIMLSIVASAALVMADGEGRAATKAEQDFMRRVYAVMKKAVPEKGPEGWQEIERDDGNIADSVGLGVESSPMLLYYSVAWEDSSRKEAARQQRESYNMNPENLPGGPDQSQQKSLEKLAIQAGDAAGRGDMKTFQRLQKEIDELGARMNAPADAADRRRSEKNKAMTPQDVSAGLRLTVNETRIAFQDDLKGPAKQAPVAGYPAYRLFDEAYFENTESWREGQTCVLVGSWKPDSKGGQKGAGAILNLKLPHTRIQNFSVCATAEPKRARALLGKVNWGVLKAALEL
jgi:hypothetical protein